MHARGGTRCAASAAATPSRDSWSRSAGLPASAVGTATGCVPRLMASVSTLPSPSRQRASAPVAPSGTASSARAPGRRGTMRACRSASRPCVRFSQSSCSGSVGSVLPGWESRKVRSSFGSGMRSRWCGSAKAANRANSRRRPSRTASASAPWWLVKYRNGRRQPHSSPMNSSGICGLSNSSACAARRASGCARRVSRSPKARLPIWS